MNNKDLSETQRYILERIDALESKLDDKFGEVRLDLFSLSNEFSGLKSKVAVISSLIGAGATLLYEKVKRSLGG